MLSFAEENYLKAVYHIAEAENKAVSTNALAEALSTKAASVTDMIKRLARKKLVDHVKYQGVTITDKGREHALQIIRKHRLWETFLVRKLGMKWDEVHDIAEQLEHIKSPLLISRLDQFLGYPRVDPHGDPIPDKHGNMVEIPSLSLARAETGKTYSIICTKDSDDNFLNYLNQLNISLGIRIQVLRQYEYDGSVQIDIEGGEPVTLSSKVTENLLIQEV